MPASYSRQRAVNSAFAHIPAIAWRPNAVLLAVARVTRESLVRRPSR